MTLAIRKTLDSLTVPNYPRYFAGQITLGGQPIPRI